MGEGGLQCHSGLDPESRNYRPGSLNPDKTLDSRLRGNDTRTYFTSTTFFIEFSLPGTTAWMK